MSLPKPMVIQNECLKKINEECKSSGNLNTLPTIKVT